MNSFTVGFENGKQCIFGYEQDEKTGKTITKRFMDTNDIVEKINQANSLIVALQDDFESLHSKLSTIIDNQERLTPVKEPEYFAQIGDYFTVLNNDLTVNNVERNYRLIRESGFVLNGRWALVDVESGVMSVSMNIDESELNLAYLLDLFGSIGITEDQIKELNQ